jgi:hypothetical protein
VLDAGEEVSLPRCDVVIRLLLASGGCCSAPCGSGLSFAGGESSGVDEASGVIGPVSEDVVEVAVPALFPSGAGVAAGPADSAISGVPAAADAENIALSWSSVTQVEPT